MVALLSLTATASYLARVNVSITGGLMMREFGISPEQMGRIFSAFVASYALFQVPGGMLAERFGAARVLAVATLGWVAATMGIAFSGGLAAVFAARLVLGMMEAPTFPAAGQAIAMRMPAGQRGRANGSVIAAIGLGSAIAPPLLSFVMSRWGWRAAVLVSAVPALAVSIAWFLIGRRGELHARPAVDAVRKRVPRSRSFVFLTLSYTLQGYVGYIFVFWFYLYLVDVRHFDLLRGALFGSLPWLLSIVSIPLGGLIFDRIPESMRRVVPVVGLGGSGVLIAIGAYVADAYVAAGCLAVATALVLGVEGPFWATMTRIAGDRSGSAGGVMNMGSNIGGLISPALTPVLARWIGWEGALLVSAGVAVVGAGLWFGVENSNVDVTAISGSPMSGGRSPIPTA